MSMNSSHVDVMVLSDTSEKAYIFMKTLVKNSNEKIISKNDYFKTIETENKTYKASIGSDIIRGYRFSNVYIDNCIDNEIIDTIIRPKLMSKGTEKTTIKFFN